MLAKALNKTPVAGGMLSTRNLAAVVLLAAVLAACSGSDSFKLVSVSMCPTLGPGDHVKTGTADELHRGDVVIVRDPTALTGNTTQQGSVPTVVTRIIAVPGDVVATQAGHLLLSGRPADEPWLAPGASTPDYFAQPYGPVAPDRYIGMGDNRVNMQTYEFSRQQVEGSAGDVRGRSSKCDEGPPPSFGSSGSNCERAQPDQPITRECADLVIFMHANAPQEAVDAVAARLRSDPAVEAVTYLDRDAAQAEFSSIMSDQPNIVVPADLPTSFHVLLKSGQDRDAARSRYLAMADVLEVIIPTR
jgi:signal peptidase I